MQKSPASPDMTKVPELVGGDLCLDFVNTVDPRHAAHRFDYLADYGALVAWARHTGAVEAVAASRLLGRAARQPDEARDVLRRAIRLREALYRVFASAIARRAPPKDALDRLNRELAWVNAKTRLTRHRDGFVVQWGDDRPRLDQVLWPVIRSALGVLVDGPLDRVRECPGPGNCGWLFIDLSKNASRRWCDMRTCGNRAKVHRYYTRIRGRRGLS
jgi:predicted RNA-binding Zn ribbon-like protein